MRRWTATADENTWRQIGQYAADPGEKSFIAGNLADTVAVDPGEIDTGEQTPARDSDAMPLAGLPIALRDSAPMLTATAGQIAAKPWELAGLSFGLFRLLAMAIVVALAAAALAIFS